MKPTKNLEDAIKKDLNFTASTDLHDRMLDDVLNGQDKSKRTRPAAKKPNIKRIIMKNTIAKLAAAAVIIISVLIGLNPFESSKTSIVWADVGESFESVPFFHMTLYITSDTPTEIRKIEAWKSEDSRVRTHDGDLILFWDFSEKDYKTVVFDRSTKELKESDRKPSGGAVKFWKDGQFSLDTLTSIFPSELRAITPLEAAETAASRETVLFEARDDTNDARITIWTLRRSRLPIRVSYSDPGNSSAKYIDWLFDYSERKDAAFFDPSSLAGQ